MQLRAWRAVDLLAHKLDAAPPPPSLWTEWEVRDDRESEPDDGEVVDSIERSLIHGNLAKAPRSSFVYALAVHRLAAACFEPAAESAELLLSRLLLNAPADSCAHLCAAAAGVRDAVAAAAGDADAAPVVGEAVARRLRSAAAEPGVLERLRRDAPGVAALAAGAGGGAGVLV